jgi:hypothetical protein
MMNSMNGSFRHLMAYHRLLAAGVFVRVMALALGSLLLFAILMLGSGLWTGRPRISAAGSAMALVAIVFSSLSILVSAGKAANAATLQITPHAGTAAFRYVFGIWWLQVLLGTLVAMMNQLPPVTGILAGVLFVTVGHIFGGRLLRGALIYLGLFFLADFELGKRYIIELAPAWQLVLYIGVLAIAAIDARGAVRAALDMESPRLTLRSNHGRELKYFERSLRGASAGKLLSLGIGQPFHVLHWALLITSTILALYLAFFGPMPARTFYAWMGAIPCLAVMGYLIQIWLVLGRHSHAIRVLALAPELPPAHEVSRAIGRTVVFRATMIAGLLPLVILAAGYAGYDRLPGFTWWLQSAMPAFLAALLGFAQYDGSPRRRVGFVLFLLVAFFLIQLTFFNR